MPKSAYHLPVVVLGFFIGASSPYGTCSGDQSGIPAASESETEEHVKSIAESTDIVAPDESRSAAGGSGDGWPDLVARVRPSVVLIRTPFGAGTGFVFGDGRWIVTNNHVVEHAPWDNQSQCQIVKVHFGNDAGGRFKLNPDAVWGKVHRVSRRTDLAVVEYQNLPPGLDQPPSLKLANRPPREGEDCFAIGMPAAGVLWTVRRGTIAGHGSYPDGFENALRLGSGEGFDERRRGNLMKFLAPEGACEITLSTCGINPGDSGGPLLDANGKLVGVTFAVPRDASLKEFGYHVHLDEIRQFLDPDVINLKEIKPPSSVVDSAQTCGVSWDRAEDHIQLIKCKNSRGAPVAYYFDVNGKSIAKLDADEIMTLNQSDLWKKCGIEWAVTHERTPTYFFDTNTDGEIDLVFIVQGGRGNDICKFERVGNRSWKISDAGTNFLGKEVRDGNSKGVHFVDGEVHFERASDQSRFQELRKQALPSLLRR